MMSQSLELETAIKAANRGAEVVNRFFRSEFLKENKTVGTEQQGLVTQADLDSEQAIVEAIKSTFPNHQFLGEETFADDVHSPHLWIIDPLDGTNNFAHGIPHFGVSVAYYQGGLGVCGAVINPVTGEQFVSERGKGAFWNGKPTSVNSHQELAQTMIGTGFYYDRGAMMKATLSAIEGLFQRNIMGIRRFGAASLDLVHVGVGQYGGFFELTLSPWDFAAAKIFIEEAAGKITTCNGSELTLRKSSVLASNGLLHDEILAIVHGSLDRI